jgi:hypothetical protein
MADAGNAAADVNRAAGIIGIIVLRPDCIALSATRTDRCDHRRPG